jgi:hypothetical protein
VTDLSPWRCRKCGELLGTIGDVERDIGNPQMVSEIPENG